MATRSIRVAASLTPDQHRQLAERAAAEDRKVANLAARLIVQGLRSEPRASAHA